MPPRNNISILSSAHPDILSHPHTMPSSPTIDHAFYPHLIDLVLDHLSDSEPTLLVLRTLCRSFKDKADSMLARHVVVSSNPDRTLRLATRAGRRIPCTMLCVYDGKYGDDRDDMSAAERAAYARFGALFSCAHVVDIVGWCRLPRSLQWTYRPQRAGQVVRQLPTPHSRLASLGGKRDTFSIPIYGDLVGPTIVWTVDLVQQYRRAWSGVVHRATGKVVLNMVFRAGVAAGTPMAITWPKSKVPTPLDVVVIFTDTKNETGAPEHPTRDHVVAPKRGGILHFLSRLDPPFDLTLVDLGAIHPCSLGLAPEGGAAVATAAAAADNTLAALREWMAECITKRNGADGSRRRRGREPWSVCAVSRDEYREQVGEEQYALETEQHTVWVGPRGTPTT